MDFAFVGLPDNENFRWFSRGLRQVMRARGHRYTEDVDSAKLVVSFYPKGEPRPVRRRANAVFVCAVTEFPVPFTNHLSQGYPVLLRSLANLVAGFVFDGDAAASDGLAPAVHGAQGDGRAHGALANGAFTPDIHFVTPEQGHYVVSGALDSDRYFDEVYQRIHPLASSNLVIDNLYEDDLPEDLWEGDETTASITRAGRHLDEMNLLPAPFPIHDYLGKRDIRHLKRLFGIGGLSYGNISARHDEDWFWMSASGVDKSRLEVIGRDILMVKGYDEERNGMLVGHPPGVVPRRVSVDAIEHWMVYREHPSVGAVLHVHGWIEGVPSTEFNYPCGTRELGQAVADIVREADDPSRCVVGLKNHGLTITGSSLDEIFERVGDRIVQTVPME